jgi:glycosyltransferase involved in cell wall biosynthesis
VQFDRVTVVPECIDTEMFNSSISGEMIRSKYGISGPLLMFQGVLVPWKGVENLLSAMSLVLKRHSQAKIMIVGDGPSLIHLKELSDDLGICENVIFTGWIPFANMPEYIAACDIGVSLRKKNLANEMVITTALLQFFAIGKPVVAPKMKTITHFVEQAENGLLFNPDDPQDLADKLIYSIDHLDKMMKMGRRETLLVRQTYDISTVAAQLKEAILGDGLFKPVRSF